MLSKKEFNSIEVGALARGNNKLMVCIDNGLLYINFLIIGSEEQIMILKNKQEFDIEILDVEEVYSILQWDDYNQ